MKRREAISTAALILGGTIIGAETFLYGCKPKGKPDLVILDADEISLLNEVGETILPATTSSPGAKEANVGEFMKIMVNDCYSQEERDVFLEGITRLREFSEKKYGKNFGNLTSDEKRSLLLDLEQESAESDLHYYTMLKQLTIVGFLTSEAGATKAMRHVAVPGRYDACIPYRQGEKAWV